MRKSLSVLIFGFLFAAAPTALAELEIFACEPEWGALAEELGGEDVKVRNATSALQDPHFVTARPSLIARVRKADLVLCNGADLEVGWLPLLLRQSNNRDVQPGTDGLFLAADYIAKLEVPATVDRALGDIHPQGNPHIVGNPHNISIVARELAARLQALDPDNAARYAARYAAFEARWQQAIAGWEERAAPLSGLPIVVQHKTWVYLTDWLGLKVITTLEPRPGIPPTTSHLQTVLNEIRDRGPRLILNAAYENSKPSRWLAERTGVPAVTLPYTVGGNDKADDIFTLYETTLTLLLDNAP